MKKKMMERLVLDAKLNFNMKMMMTLKVTK